MATAITEVSTYTATVYVPDDGEDADSDSLKDNFVQGLADRTLYLKDAIEDEVSDREDADDEIKDCIPGLGDEVLIRAGGFPVVNVSTRFSFDYTGTGYHTWYQNSVADRGRIIWSTRTWSQLGSTATDSSATTGAYELTHSVDVTFSEAINSNDRIYVHVQGESSTNAITGLEILDIVGYVED